MIKMASTIYLIYALNSAMILQGLNKIQRITAEYESNLQLNCTDKLNVYAKFYQWFREGILMDDSNNVSFLIINGTSMDDGQYKCRYTNGVHSKEMLFSVRFLKAITIKALKSTVNATVGSEIELGCLFNTTKLHLNVTWLKCAENGNVYSKGHNYTVLANQIMIDIQPNKIETISILIDNISKQDYGCYGCAVAEIDNADKLYIAVINLIIENHNSIEYNIVEYIRYGLVLLSIALTLIVIIACRFTSNSKKIMILSVSSSRSSFINGNAYQTCSIYSNEDHFSSIK
ncbi:hypothetical protein GJ496_011190 [Pomphorhynchus laevis]|nr:hypothetical protein GJ496_011190 [Pomphorhynchus laevis]